MAGLKRILSRTFFWSYERGTWQYDVAVALVLVFVLLTPRGWFRDQPQVGLPAASDQVQLVLFSDDGHRQEYRVDARVLAPPEQTPLCRTNCTRLYSALSPICATADSSIAKSKPCATRGAP